MAIGAIAAIVVQCVAATGCGVVSASAAFVGGATAAPMHPSEVAGAIAAVGVCLARQFGW